MHLCIKSAYLYKKALMPITWILHKNSFPEAVLSDFSTSSCDKGKNLQCIGKMYPGCAENARDGMSVS